MRAHGYLGSAAGSVPFGHLGWGYRDRAEFLRHAAAYIADGLRHNQRIAYVGEASGKALRAELTAMSRIDERLDWADVEITPATEYYHFRPGDVIDAEPVVARCVSAAEQAIDDGYRGLRTVVDVTPMARTPEQRDALARLEYLVDQEMAARPYASLCGYDAGQLSTAAGELVCLHPFVDKGSVPFQIYADPDADVHFALTGEIDAASNDLFTTTLQRIWPLMPDHTLRIDAGNLEFIGHQQLCMLEESAREQNRKVVLCTNQRIAVRLVDLLNLSNVRVEPPPVYPTGVAEAERQLQSQPAIEQVKGMLMQNFGLDAQDAFALLACLSQDTNTKLMDVAARIRDELTENPPAESRQATPDALTAFGTACALLGRLTSPSDKLRAVPPS
jgi:anti-anti-sigma regulatory factor